MTDTGAVAVVALGAVGHPRLISSQSLTSLAQQSAFFGIKALGVMFLLAMRELDLSVGHQLHGLLDRHRGPGPRRPKPLACCGRRGCPRRRAGRGERVPRQALQAARHRYVSEGTLTAYRGLAQNLSHRPAGGQLVLPLGRRDALGHAHRRGQPTVVGLNSPDRRSP